MEIFISFSMLRAMRMRSCCSTYRKFFFNFTFPFAQTHNQIIAEASPLNKTFVKTFICDMGGWKVSVIRTTFLGITTCCFLQFHWQRQVKRHHHLRGRWQLSPCWDPTVSVYVLGKPKRCDSRRTANSVSQVWSRVTRFRYKNIPHMSFDDTGREPEQAFRLNRDPLAELEYPTKWVQREHFSFSAGFAASRKAPLPWCKRER